MAVRKPKRAQARAASQPARLVLRDDGPSFLERVRDKFELPGDPDVGGPD